MLLDFFFFFFIILLFYFLYSSLGNFHSGVMYRHCETIEYTWIIYNLFYFFVCHFTLEVDAILFPFVLKFLNLIVLRIFFLSS